MQNAATKNSQYSINETILRIAKNFHQAAAIAFAKSSFGVKKWKKNKSTLQLNYAKTSSKKQLIFEKCLKIAKNAH